MFSENINSDDVQNNYFKITIINMFKEFKGAMNRCWNKDHKNSENNSRY